MIPRLRPEEQRREETLETETPQDILDYLSTYQYASTEHAVFALLWETGIRFGAANSLDVEDLDTTNRQLTLLHRPDQGTQLKNGSGGERPVALSEQLATVLDQYVDNRRTSGTDDYDRRPLFTTSNGRMCRTTIRRLVYRVTAPCFRNERCPGCVDRANKCPEAVSPHSIRRGSITHFLSQDVPVEIVGDRMDVSRDVLDKHYDQRTEARKSRRRREALEASPDTYATDGGRSCER